MPSISELLKRFIYFLSWVLVTVVGTWFVRIRASGIHVFPRNKSVLILSNHQSYLDPPIIGVALPRRLRYTARASLFRFAPFGWYLSALGAIPLNREGVSAGGMKVALKYLGNKDALVYFPEGTRTSTGEMGPLKRGVSLVLRRTDAYVILCGIAGSFDVWSRKQPLPSPGAVWVHFKKWERRDFEDEKELLADLEKNLHEVVEEAKRRREMYVKSIGGILPSSADKE